MPKTANPYGKRYLSTKELSKSIPLSERSLRRKIKEGVFMKGIHFRIPRGAERVMWDWYAIEKWVES